jgi:hypothetical protein
MFQPPRWIHFIMNLTRPDVNEPKKEKKKNKSKPPPSAGGGFFYQ